MKCDENETSCFQPGSHLVGLDHRIFKGISIYFLYFLRSHKKNNFSKVIFADEVYIISHSCDGGTTA